jgi:hypothetical protein
VATRLELYCEASKGGYAILMTANTTRAHLFINGNDSAGCPEGRGYVDLGTDNRIDGSAINTATFKSLSCSIPGTNVAGNYMAVAGGRAGAGATAHAGGDLNLYGGGAYGTAGDVAGGAVRIRGGEHTGTARNGNINIVTTEGANVTTCIVGDLAYGSQVSTALEVQSTTQALLLSRMTTTQRDLMTPLNGMLIYNTTTNKFEGYENGSWTSLI